MTINNRLGITQLNAMQRAMQQTTARNIMLHAPTGSGKTVAFALPMLQRMGHGAAPAAVIIVPSRELALQITDVLRRLDSGRKLATLYGGHSMDDERASLAGSPDIIIATPGRFVDHIHRGSLPRRMPSVNVLVIDEYDKALTLGFSREMRLITAALTAVKSVLLTSATAGEAMTAEIFGDMPFEVLSFDTTAAQAPAQQIAVNIVTSPERDKLATLTAMLRRIGRERTIVFVNHRESAERVWQTLLSAGIDATIYHGGMEQRERERAVIMLNNGTAPVLVATDLAARGLDIDNVATVIHYHLPLSADIYTHRNGRTARQGASGRVFIIAGPGETTPEYITADTTDADAISASPDPLPRRITLYVNAGRREKVSRGDIVGFLCKTAGIDAADIGTIDVLDHASYVAVAAAAIKLIPKGNQRLKTASVRFAIAKTSVTTTPRTDKR